MMTYNMKLRNLNGKNAMRKQIWDRGLLSLFRGELPSIAYINVQQILLGKGLEERIVAENYSTEK